VLDLGEATLQIGDRALVAVDLLALRGDLRAQVLRALLIGLVAAAQVRPARDRGEAESDGGQQERVCKATGGEHADVVTTGVDRSTPSGGTACRARGDAIKTGGRRRLSPACAPKLAPALAGAVSGRGGARCRSCSRSRSTRRRPWARRCVRRRRSGCSNA